METSKNPDASSASLTEPTSSSSKTPNSAPTVAPISAPSVTPPSASTTISKEKQYEITPDGRCFYFMTQSILPADHPFCRLGLPGSANCQVNGMA